MVKQYIINGFPSQCPDEIMKYKRVKMSLTIEEDAIFFKERIVIPKLLRNQVFFLLIKVTMEQS